MRITSLTVFAAVTLLNSVIAAGFPLVLINSFSCYQTGYDQSMRDLFIKVNQVGKVERRHDLSGLRGLKAAGFTENDINRAKICGGVVFCPASGPDSSDYVTAFSLVSADQVFIPAHLFFNKDARGIPTTPRSNLDNCYFFNYIHPAEHIPLKLGKTQFDRIRNLDPGSKFVRDQAEDGIKIKLARSIPGCHPFDVDRSGKPMRAGEVVLSIGAPTPDIVPRPSGHEPVGQFCQIRKPLTFSGEASYYYSDCSNSPGQSGAIEFEKIPIKRKDGEIRYKWVAKAMEIRGGGANLNGQDFNIAIGSGTASIGIESDHLRDVLNEHESQINPAEHMANSKKIGI